MNQNAYQKIIDREPNEDLTRVLIIPGHSLDKPGAYNKKLDIYEHDVVMEIATEMLKKEKNKSLSLILTSRNSYSKLPNELNHLNPDFIISLHLNAFNGEAQGIETLYYKNSDKSKLLSQIIQKDLLELGYDDRGVKGITENDRGGHLLFNTKTPCVIIEPFFIDSIESKGEIERNIKLISDILLKTLYNNFT
ncbi:MAG: N-acetylmuramoyl-L-alanine amidase [bacterium]